VQAVATDGAGNSTTSAIVTIYKDATTPVVASGAPSSGGGGGGGGGGADTTAPTISITAPSGGGTVSGSVAVSAAASDNVGVAGVQFKLNGSNLGPEDTTSPFAITWDTRTAADGPQTLTAVARDAAGNTTTSSSVTVTVANNTGGGGGDTTPPSVVIDQPQNGAWTGASLHVIATATDGVALATLKLYGDGVQFGNVNCAGATTCSYNDWWVTGSLPSGQHTITAVATDLAGNSTTSSPVVINK
jgi:hypothetical protein